MRNYSIKGLPDYSKESLISEIRRVAELIKQDKITKAEFNKYSKVDVSTIRRKFNGWRNALIESGLGHRYSGQIITQGMKEQAGKGITNEELLEEIRQIAVKLNKEFITHRDFNNNSIFHSSTVVSRFSSWDKALRSAGLKSHIRPKLTKMDLFENILTVWLNYGRQPKCSEMNVKPSTISSTTYLTKFGSWMKALHEFEIFVNSDNEVQEKRETDILETQDISTKELEKKETEIKPEFKRNIPLGLRYQILKRDRFRCVKCGKSPATELNCKLHIDHILPFSKGGKTVINNLQTTCQECNLGKGNRDTE